MPSAVGPLLVAATGSGLRCVQFHRGKLPAAAADEQWVESQEQVRSYELLIEAYLRGELRAFATVSRARR